MHVHMPKPLHGWREFIGEVGIIVIGVLIALAAEEMVQKVHWNEAVDQAQESLNEQLMGSYFASRELVLQQDCIARQLARLDTLVDRPELPTHLNRIRSSLRPWSTSAWDAVVSSGAVAHMPADRRNNYAELFDTARLIGAMQRQRFDVAAELSTIYVHPRMTDVYRDRIIRNIAQLKYYNQLLGVASGQWLQRARTLGLSDAMLEPDSRLTLAQPQACPMPDDPPPARTIG